MAVLMRGFTIIEVMLFLSISGVLFVGLMIGVNNSIEHQRYRDSVVSLTSLLQQQYSEVINTRNDRNDTWNCRASIATPGIESGQPRGTSDCVVLGRYIQTRGNNSILETGDVIGSEPLSVSTGDSDIGILLAYQPKVAATVQTQYTPEWGVALRNPEGQAIDFSALILRSPSSGLIKVFVNHGAMPPQLIDMINNDAAKQKITICVESDNWSAGPTQAVVIDAAIAGANGITTREDGSGC